jgi:pimeloyl-ACP methyl ester carboxylesterase
MTQHSVLAQDPRPNGTDTPRPPRVSSHFGSSPFDPPQANDATFVIDQDGGLDTGCTFAGGGPLEFTIEVGRVVGDLARLKANGLISRNAVLRMPAYDVDFGANAPGINPERDRVLFNGHVVPTEFLTGENGVWKLNAFNIPIDWVSFPSDPGAGNQPTTTANVIQIHIDVANTSEYWCTEIDWAALSIEVARPVVMAHGIFSSGTIWSNVWVPRLNVLGLPSSNRLNMGSLDGIADNAAKIAAEVANAKQRWGVDKVVLVGHSKGGIDARHFVENNDDAQQLIQLGTPNAGSRLADIAQGLLVVSTGLPNTVLINGLAGPAGVQLTRPFMKTYNLFHGANHSVSYTALAGDYEPDCFALNIFCRPVLRSLLLLSGSPGDTIVPVSSVHALGYTDDRTFASSGENTDATHSGLHTSQAVFNRVQDRVRALGTSKARFQRSAASLSEGPTKGQAPPTFFSTGDIVGDILQGQTKEHTLSIDSADEALFSLLFPSGDLDLTLVTPSGVVIDPTSAANDPLISHEQREIVGGLIEAYGVGTPEAGDWKLRVAGASVTELSGSVSYALSALLERPAITFEASLESENVCAGETLTLLATLLENGAPTTGAAVTAKVALPDETALDLVLHDNGTGPDQQAGDGVYTGAFTQTAQAGNYRILFAANRSGTAAPDFSRKQFALATVSRSESTFTGSFSDFGLDSDGDGNFDQLVIETEIDVTAAAQYRVYGLLEDANGNALESNLVATLGAGSTTVLLGFDGVALYENGVDGPYSLSLIRMAEEGENEILPVDEVADAFTTAPYSFNDFEHGPILLTGGATAQGIDTDADGLYDFLSVEIDVVVDLAGTYEWSARLTDLLGREVGFAAGSSFFSAGANKLTFVFDGERIGSFAVDGPYQVTDLLLFGATHSLVRLQVLTTPAFLASEFEGYAAAHIFTDGFESGNTSSWSRTLQ